MMFSVKTAVCCVLAQPRVDSATRRPNWE